MFSFNGVCDMLKFCNATWVIGGFGGPSNTRGGPGPPHLRLCLFIVFSDRSCIVKRGLLTEKFIVTFDLLAVNSLAVCVFPAAAESAVEAGFWSGRVCTKLGRDDRWFAKVPHCVQRESACDQGAGSPHCTRHPRTGSRPQPGTSTDCKWCFWTTKTMGGTPVGAGDMTPTFRGKGDRGT